MADQSHYYPSHTTPHPSLTCKKQLVDSFKQFTGNTVSQDSLILAKKCVDRSVSSQERYSIIEFDKYLKQNEDTPSYLTMMTSAYDLLLKYVINLLKVKRPQVWRSIKTNNTAFKARVACMKGAEEILSKAGYTESRENSMCFPDSVDEPDKARLSVIAAELLMAKLEVEDLNNVPSSSPRQQRSSNIHGPVEALQQQTESFQIPRHPNTQQFEHQQANLLSLQKQYQSSQYSTYGHTQGMNVHPQTSFSHSQHQLPVHTSKPDPYNPSTSGYSSFSSTGHYGTSGSSSNASSSSGQYSHQGARISRIDNCLSHSGQHSVNPDLNSGSNYSDQVMAGVGSASYETRVDPDLKQSGLTNGRQRSGDLGALQTNKEPTGVSPVPKARPRKARTSFIKSVNDDKQPTPGSYSPQDPHLNPSPESHSPQEPHLHHSRSEEPLTSMGSHKSSSGEISTQSEDSPASSVCLSATEFLKKFREDKKKADEALNKKTGKSGPQPTPRVIPGPGPPKAATSVHTLQKKTPIGKSHLLGGSDPELIARTEGSGYKLPPKKKQPIFHDDPILEAPEQSLERHLPTQGKQLPPQTAPGERELAYLPSYSEAPPPPPETVRPVLVRYCSECKCKLSADHRFCCYCGTPASPHPPQPTHPPELIEEDLPPLRASHDDTLKAEEYHRKTRILDPTQHFSPEYNPQLPPQRPPKPVNPVTEPSLPPKPKPRQTPTGPPIPRPAWEGAPSTDKQLPAPPIPPKPHFISPEPHPTQDGGWAPKPHPTQDGGRAPKPHPTQDGGREGSQANASGSSDDYLSKEFMSMPGIKYLLDKEAAYKQKQRKDGVREQDLKPLQELEDKRQEYKAHGQAVQLPPKPKEVDLSKYPAVDMSLAPVDLSDSNESRRMDELALHGRALLDSLKECVPLGFSLDEIQLAYDRNRQSLDYLRTEWMEMTEQARHNLSVCTTDKGCHVGTPSAKEMREALAKARGNMKAAESYVFKERQNKVEELLARVAEIRKCNKNIPELTWDGAVQVLSVNNMDVDTAYYVLQCDWLKPLYDYIFDEKNKNVLVNKEEMEKIKRVITNKEIDSKSHRRMLMAECKFPTEEEANIVLQLLQAVEESALDYPLQYFIEAVKDHSTFEKARNFLIKECSICWSEYPVHEFVALPGCIHSVCKHCFKDNFTYVITNQEVKHFTCPICGEPDMANQDITEGFYLQLFLQLVKTHLDKECFKLCDDKLTEFNLIKDPSFIWCANTECRSGFIHEGRADDVGCPNCHRSMCRKCKKQWEPAHEGISCEAFAQWKIDNDPDAQEQGLAAHLQANGIECPGCHFKYDLAKGGCMHFKCGRCPNEFCSGCGQSFKNGLACGKFDSCKTRGLHAHHPRDCLFFMRDFDVEELQEFLKEHNIPYDTKVKETPKETPAKEEGQVADGEPAEPAAAKGCRVMLQKETPEGLKDEECGGEVMDCHAGLCRVHYKEYLVDLINKNKLDPITMYATNKIELMLIREEMPVLEKDDDDDDDTYREKLIEHVKQNLPLPNKGGVVLNPPAAPAPPPDAQPPAAAEPA